MDHFLSPLVHLFGSSKHRSNKHAPAGPSSPENPSSSSARRRRSSSSSKKAGDHGVAVRVESALSRLFTVPPKVCDTGLAGGREELDSHMT